MTNKIVGDSALMKKIKDKIFIDKIIERAAKKLRVEEVCVNSDLEIKTIDYLIKQEYLEFSKIEIILKNNFLHNYPFGYALIDQHNEIVGFMGTIFSMRTIENKEHIYCNIHTWIVDKSFRINSFLLLTKLMKKNIILTAFTPIKTLVGLFEKFGFEKIKMRRRIIFLFHFPNFVNKKQHEIEKNRLLIEKLLNENDLNLYRNYFHVPCEKFVIVDKNDKTKYIFIIAAKFKIRGFQTLNLFYVSDNLKLKKDWDLITSIISKEFKVSFCVQTCFDERDCSIPNKALFTINLTRDICVNNLSTSSKLDILYSDLLIA